MARRLRLRSVKGTVHFDIVIYKIHNIIVENVKNYFFKKEKSLRGLVDNQAPGNGEFCINSAEFCIYREQLE